MGFCVFISALQAIMFTLLMPESHFWNGPAAVRDAEKVPPLVQFMVANVSWARVYFVVFLALGMLGTSPVYSSNTKSWVAWRTLSRPEARHRLNLRNT